MWTVVSEIKLVSGTKDCYGSYAITHGLFRGNENVPCYFKSKKNEKKLFIKPSFFCRP